MLFNEANIPQAIPMRAPCAACGCNEGYVTERNGQDVVRCSRCHGWAYNQPKSESGKPQRSVRTRPEISPSQKARILERDNGTCVICHCDDKPLHVGHFLSVNDAKEVGATEDEIYDDENLAAMCEECNLGQSKRSVSLRLVFHILRARIKRKQDRREARNGWE
jgi:5-methylcytosine-specific restriction endonuclease McrA